MKNRVKLVAVGLFALFGLMMFLGSVDRSNAGPAGLLPLPTPTPKANTAANTKPVVNANTNANKPANTTAPANANVAANTAPKANTTTPAAGDKKMRENFVLGLDSLDAEYGATPFNHRTHAFEKYSPDGKSVVGCVECHHTDQPKSAMKPPLVTSERDVILTFDNWKGSKVTECRACHFQPENVPDGKVMPTADYVEDGETVTKELNNKLAYHINCNVCHDKAAELRPSLKQKKGFAVGSDCAGCHSGGN